MSQDRLPAGKRRAADLHRGVGGRPESVEVEPARGQAEPLPVPAEQLRELRRQPPAPPVSGQLGKQPAVSAAGGDGDQPGLDQRRVKRNVSPAGFRLRLPHGDEPATVARIPEVFPAQR